MTVNAEDYPYNPKLKLADISKAVGLDRLRWIANRAQAQLMADLYEHAHLPSQHQVSERFDAGKRVEQRKRLALVAEASMRGDHGDEARDLSHQYFNRSPQEADLTRLQSFLADLQRLHIDVHQMPSRRGGGRRFRGDE